MDREVTEIMDDIMSAHARAMTRAMAECFPEGKSRAIEVVKDETVGRRAQVFLCNACEAMVLKDGREHHAGFHAQQTTINEGILKLIDAITERL